MDDELDDSWLPAAPESNERMAMDVSWIPDERSVDDSQRPNQDFAPRGGAHESDEACDDSWIPSSARGVDSCCQDVPVKSECGETRGTIKLEPQAGVRPGRRLRLRGKVKLEQEPNPGEPFRRLRRKTSLAMPSRVKHEVKHEASGEVQTHRAHEAKPEAPPAPHEHWTTRDAKIRSERRRTEHKRFAWKCDVCCLNLTTGQYDALRFARHNHISRVHKGVPKSRFSQL